MNKPISLPNGCYIYEMKISPKNLDIEKDWIIYYSFYDPEYPKPKLRQIRGMNHLTTVAERKREVKKLMDLELGLLMDGFNPFKNKIIKDNSEVSADTPFITALNKALEKVKVEPTTLIDIKSVVKGTSLAARQLGIEDKPIKNISRKYFKSIFETCEENNPRFSANRKNVYRKWLKKLFDELIEMEAVETNPLVFIKKEKITKKERTLPNDEQRRKINKYLKENHYYFWRAMQIYFTLDARQTELFRIQAKHVDLENQSCLCLIKKGKHKRWIGRPIIDAAMFLWREIMSECKSDEDFIFSEGLIPGKKKISAIQFGRRWQRDRKSTRL